MFFNKVLFFISLKDRWKSINKKASKSLVLFKHSFRYLDKMVKTTKYSCKDGFWSEMKAKTDILLFLMNYKKLLTLKFKIVFTL